MLGGSRPGGSRRRPPGHGTVKAVTQGTVMAEIVVEIAGGHELVSAITAESARHLGLAPGKRVFVVVKSTEVMIGVDD